MKFSMRDLGGSRTLYDTALQAMVANPVTRPCTLFYQCPDSGEWLTGTGNVGSPRTECGVNLLEQLFVDLEDAAHLAASYSCHSM